MRQKWRPIERCEKSVYHAVLLQLSLNSPLITQLCESTLIIDSQVRLIFYCLQATDRVICIYKFTSCFRLMLPLLDP